MPRLTQAQRVLKLAAKKGLLRPRDLQTIKVPAAVLARLTASGEMEKISRGLYRLSQAHVTEYEDLIAVARKVPQAVFCLLTALQFHELTTQLPRDIWIAMPHGSHTPKLEHPPLTMVQYTCEAYEAGIETPILHGVPLRVYSIAKTVADCFKHRNKIGIDVAIEALKDARRDNRVPLDDIWHFAKICRVSRVMLPYLEVVQ